jgi:KDO2-lipid IV(A) lauroyltransferase
MKQAGYLALRSITWFVHLFPLRVSYLFSDVLYFIAYHLIGYRKLVVRKNLTNSFPEKSLSEIIRIEKKFYHHLCDLFFETFYFERMSGEEIQKRVKFINPSLPNNYLKQGKSVVVLMGHYNNWELLVHWPLISPYKFYPIYKKLNNPSFNRFYYDMRSRFGGIPLERSDTYRQLMADYSNGIPTFSTFIFDQTPRIFDIQYWTTFLNQSTPVVVGAEKIARKINAVVLFAHMKKIKRGYYELEFSLITENIRGSSKFAVIEEGTRRLEQTIRKEPAYWLWSHKRWKHKKPIEAESGNR